MTTKKKISEGVKKMVDRAKTPPKLMILHIPEHSPETSPHWLLWILVITLTVLAFLIVGSRMITDPTIQNYLPTI